MKLLIAVAVAATFATGALASPAPEAALAADDCILVHQVRNHTIVDQNTILLNVYQKGVYRVTSAQACFRSAVAADPISFNTRGREKICKASQLGLQARSGWCGAQSIAKLSPDEVAALPKKLKP